MNIYYVYDVETNKAEGHFFAENDIFAERRFMLNLKSFPAEIRDCFNLVRLCEISSDGRSVVSDSSSVSVTVCVGSMFDDWIKTHTKKGVDNNGKNA